MGSMSEFLSGFSNAGESVIQQGQIDPSRRREGLGEIGSFGLGGDSRGDMISQILSRLQGGLAGERPSPFGGGLWSRGKGLQPGDISPEQIEALMSGMNQLNKPQYGMQGGQLNLDPSDFVFGGPEIFARLLQSAEMDGGYLSDASQNAQFGAQTAGMMGLQGAQNRDRLRGASAANLNPVFAERQNINTNYDVMSQILGQRAQLSSQLAERQFGAQEGFANMLAQTDASQKMFKVNTQAALAGAQMGAEGAIQGGEAAARGAKSAGAMGMVGGILGGALMGGI